MNNLKRMLVVSLVVGSGIQLYAQTNTGLARVSKVKGVEAYILNEPIRSFETVLDKKTGLKITSLLTGGLINESPSDKVEQFVKVALKKAKKEGKTFDAIVYTGGKNVLAVKFTEPATPNNESIAKVKKVNGLEAYVMSEPMKPYELVNNKNGGIKLKSALTKGYINNSIEDDVAQSGKRILKDANDANKQVDLIIYSSGKSSSGAKFK